MKKVLCALLVVLMIFTLASCATDTGRDIYQLYVRANEAMQGIDSLDMDMDMDMTIRADGEVMDMKIASNIRQVIRSETDIDMAMNMKMSMMDMDINTKMFYKDGVYYMEMMGMKMKMPMPIEEIMSQVNTEVIEFPESAIKDMEINDVDDGVELSFTLDGAALGDELAKQMGSMEEMLGAVPSYTFGDVTLRTVIGKDDKFKSVSMAFAFDMDMYGETVQADCVIDMDFIKFGGVIVDFPTDLDDYAEVDF